MERVKPDVLCLQETKAQQHQSPIDLPEYEEYWNSAEKKGYSGTAIFTKQKPLSVHFDFPEEIAHEHGLAGDGYGDPNSEGRVIAIELSEYYVVCVYTPNAKDDLSRLALREHWDSAFLMYMQELEEEKPVVFCGDLNVAHTPDDLARPKENEGNKGFTQQERTGIQAYVDNGFVDTFRLFTHGNGHYTWWSYFNNARDNNVGWRIDYIFTSEALAERVSKAAIHSDIFGSDHCPISTDIT